MCIRDSPYAAWMQQSSLLLRQDLKDCCDTQTLGIDTLRYRLPFASALHTETATVTKEQNENKAITKRVLPHTVRPAKTGNHATAVLPAPQHIEKIVWSNSDLDLYICLLYTSRCV